MMLLLGFVWGSEDDTTAVKAVKNEQFEAFSSVKWFISSLFTPDVLAYVWSFFCFPSIVVVTLYVIIEDAEEIKFLRFSNLPSG